MSFTTLNQFIHSPYRELSVSHTLTLIFPRCSAYLHIFYNSFPLEQECSSLSPCLQDAMIKCLQIPGCVMASAFPLSLAILPIELPH